MKHPSKSTSNVKFEKESVEIVKCSLSSAPVLYRIPCGEHKVHVQGKFSSLVERVEGFRGRETVLKHSLYFTNVKVILLFR